MFSKKVMLWMLGFALSVIAAELVLVTTEISLPTRFVFDPIQGRMMRPGARINVFAEGMCIGKVNEYGYVGPARPRQRKEGVSRIAVIGDSYVAGLYILERRHFVHRFEEGLRERWGERVEVLNFGEVGADFPRMVAHDLDFAAGFNPDVCLYVLKLDDFTRSSRSLGPRPVLVDGELEMDRSFVQAPEYRVSRRLGRWARLGWVTLVSRTVRRAQAGEAWSQLFGKFARASVGVGAETAAELSRPDEEGKVVRELDRALVRRLVERREAGGPKIVLGVTWPLSPAYTRLFRSAGIPIIEIHRVFDQMRARGEDPHWWPVSQTEGHWNPAAQEAVASLLVEWFDTERERLGL